MGRHLTPDERNTIVRGWRESGLSARRYCHDHDLNLATFRRWASMATTEPKPPATFVRLEVATRGELAVEARGARIVVTSGFDAALLCAVVDALVGGGK